MKSEQEQACAQVFLKWITRKHGVHYRLRRAEDQFGLDARWDFVANMEGSEAWIAIEIKGLVLPASRRQVRSWDSFLSHVTRQLKTKVRGSYSVIASIPWAFSQQESKNLLEPFIDALAELDDTLESGEETNLGPNIAAKFPQWPTKPPTSDEKLWLEQRVLKFITPPKDLFVLKDADDGSSVQLFGSVGQAIEVDTTLTHALLGIFSDDGGKGAKPNVQLDLAKGRGASETVLLLDSHIVSRPNTVAQVLTYINQSLLSNIDAVYLVGVGDNEVGLVWPKVN